VARLGEERGVHRVLVGKPEGFSLSTYISMYKYPSTNRCYSERGSSNNYVRSSIPRSNIYILYSVLFA
jgi:hypothetical protein